MYLRMYTCIYTCNPLMETPSRHVHHNAVPRCYQTYVDVTNSQQFERENGTCHIYSPHVHTPPPLHAQVNEKLGEPVARAKPEMPTPVRLCMSLVHLHARMCTWGNVYVSDCISYMSAIMFLVSADNIYNLTGYFMKGAY